MIKNVEDIKGQDELIEYLFFLKANTNVSEEEFQKIAHHKKFHLNDEEINEGIRKYEMYYDNIHEKASMKISNSQFLRYFMKDVYKQLKVTISKNRFKNAMSYFFADIISSASFKACKNIYQYDYIDLIEQSIDDKHLQQQFYHFLKKALIPYISDTIECHKHAIENYNDIYIDLHGEYIYEMIHDSDCQTIKDDIVELLSYDFYEIDKFVDSRQEDYESYFQEDEIEEVFQQFKEERKDDIFNQISKDFNLHEKEAFQNIMNDVLNEGELYDPQMMKFIQLFHKKGKQAYQQNFLYDKDEYMEMYVEQVFPIAYRLHNILQKEKRISFIEFILFITRETNFDCVDKINQSDEDSFLQGLEMATDFIMLTAYYLYMSSHYDKQEEEKIVKQFLNILVTSQECQDIYMNLLNNKEMYQSHWRLSKLVENQCQIITAVLYNLDHPKIAKKVKPIILSTMVDKEHQTQNEIYNQLALYNKEHFKDYWEDTSDFSYSKIGEYAKVFILSYLKDPIYIAANCVFINYANDVIFEQYRQHNKRELFDGQITKMKNFYKEPKLIGSYVDLYDSLIDNSTLFSNVFQHYQNVLSYVGKEPILFTHISDLSSLLQKYRLDAIAMMYLTHKARKEDIHEWKQDKQFDFITMICLLFYFIDEIEYSQSFVPAFEIDNSENEIDYLKKESSLLHKQIDTQDKMIKQYQLMMDKQNKRHQDEMNREIKKQISLYKEDVVKLQQIIKKKDKEIAKLKENQQELYKLRAMMFNLENNQDIDVDESIDLHSLIQDKSVVLVGGHRKLITKLKEKYPSFRTIGNDASMNDKIIENADYIFIFYTFLGHNLYYQIMNIVGNQNHIQWDYIPYTNVEKVEHDMFYKIKKWIDD